MEPRTEIEKVEYVWTAPFSFGTVLFGFNRYLPFIDTFMLLNRALRWAGLVLFLTDHRRPQS